MGLRFRCCPCFSERSEGKALAVFRPHLYRFDLIGDCPALSRGGFGHMSDTELLLKRKAAEQAGAVRRVEVFTGAGRRRRWSSEQKADRF